MAPTPQQIEHAMIQNLEIATTAAQMAASISLVLLQRGLLDKSQARQLALLSRSLGERFEEHGDDEQASDFGAVAAMLLAPRADGK